MNKERSENINDKLSQDLNSAEQDLTKIKIVEANEENMSIPIEVFEKTKEKIKESHDSLVLKHGSQQKEFIEWLESMLVSELGVFTEIKICDVLSKYKETIGGKNE